MCMCLLVFLSFCVDAGGSKEGKACDKCRKGKEPSKTKKFPTGVTNCSSKGPTDTTRAFYDGMEDNPNCPAPPTPGTGNSSGCYDSPSTTSCSKKDTKKGEGKMHSSVTSGSTNSAIQGLAVTFLVLIVIGVGLYFIANASGRKNFGMTMTNLNLNYSLAGPEADIGGAKPVATTE